jgi:hypothetical protein
VVWLIAPKRASLSRHGVQVHIGHYDISRPFLHGDEPLDDDGIGLALTPRILLDYNNTATYLHGTMVLFLSFFFF